LPKPPSFHEVIVSPFRHFTPTIAALVLLAASASAQSVGEAAVSVGPFSDYVEVPANRIYASAEYLVWWLQEARVPPTLTTSSTASRGVLDQPDTRILYGGDRLETRHDDRFIGTRFALGLWLDAAQLWALEGGGFFLERDSTYFKKTSNGSILLARPYIDARDGSMASEIIAGPTADGVRTGAFQGYSRVELFGQEANVVRNLVAIPDGRFDLLVGARFAQLRDRTDFTATGRLLPDQAILYGLTDHYRAHNAFYGGQLGLRGSRQLGIFSLDVRGAAALGANLETVRAFGDRIYHTPLTRVVTPTGLTVQASNTGRFERTEANAIYQVGANLGCAVTDHIKIFGGYTLFLWDGALRSGDQVDLVVNAAQVAGGPQRPGIPFKDDFFWAHGFNVGLAFTW
jgi:hypothetical protein